MAYLCWLDRRHFSALFLGLLAAGMLTVAAGGIGAFDWFFDGECAGVPKVVAYQQGMTLCPGQTAIMSACRAGQVKGPSWPPAIAATPASAPLGSPGRGFSIVAVDQF